MRPIRRTLLAITAALAVTSAGVAWTESSARAADPKPNVSAADTKFLADSYSINEGEILLGHLAEQRATVQSVRSFAHRMVVDHARALDLSRQVANKVHVALPVKVDAATQAQFDDLSKKSGRDFDTAYASAMLAGHLSAVKEFSDEAASGQDDSVKGYAKNQLPMLEQHLVLARQLVEQQVPGVAQPQPR